MNYDSKRNSVYLVDIENRQSINNSNSILIETNALESNFFEEFEDIPGIRKKARSKTIYNKGKHEWLTIISYSGFLILFFNIFKSYQELLLMLSFFSTIIIFFTDKNKIMKISIVKIKSFIFLVIWFDLSYYFLFIYFTKENSLEKIMMISFDIIFVIYYNTYNNISTNKEFIWIFIPVILFVISIAFIVNSYGISYNLLSCILFLFLKSFYSVRKNIFLKDNYLNISTFLFYFFLINFIFINIMLLIISIYKFSLFSTFFDCYYPLFSLKFLAYILLSILYLIYYKNIGYIFKNNYKSILVIQPFTAISSLIWGIILGFIKFSFIKNIIKLIVIVLLLQGIANSIIYYIINNFSNNNINIKRKNTKRTSIISMNLLSYYE